MADAGLIRFVTETIAAADRAAVISALVLVIIVLAAAGETAWHVARGRNDSSRSLAVALVMGLGGLVVGGLLAAVIAAELAWWGSLAPDGLVSWWESHPIIATIAAFVAFDAVGFAHHTVGHRTAIGWAAHQPHHSGPRFELSLALRQTWFPVHGVLILPVVALGGWSPQTIAGCAAVSRLLQGLQHSSADWPVPATVRWLMMTPRQHRLHHASSGAVNLGPVFTCWDRMAGTYRPGFSEARPEPYRRTSRDDPLRVQLAGWHALVVRAASPTATESVGRRLVTPAVTDSEPGPADRLWQW